VLTQASGEEVYGAALIVHEPAAKYAKTHAKTITTTTATGNNEETGGSGGGGGGGGGGADGFGIDEDGTWALDLTPTTHIPKAVCVLSRWPFYTQYRAFLTHFCM
jgi:hypothetical protein